MRTPGSGRKKGSGNKKSLLVAEKAMELGVDPFEILLKFASADWKALGYKEEYQVTKDGARLTISPEVRLKAASEACQYILPKKKAMEISNGENGFKLIIEDYTTKK